MQFSTFAVASAVIAAASAGPLSSSSTNSGSRPSTTSTHHIPSGTGIPKPANSTEWTIENFSRVCHGAEPSNTVKTVPDVSMTNGTCKFSFGINTHPNLATPAPSARPAPSASPLLRTDRVRVEPDTNSTYPCSYSINGTAPARQSYGSIHCGPGGRFVISSTWSGQFGPGHGFSTMAIVDKVMDVIVYPAYTDAQLANNTVVKPNLSFQVNSFSGLAN